MGADPKNLKGTRALFLLAALAFAETAVATPSGYFIDSTQASAERPRDLVASDGDFTFSIRRSYDGPLAGRLLSIAEATYPPRETLVERAIARGWEIGSDSARTPLWWCEGLGVSRVPYAVTAGALDFYKNLTERFRDHNFWGAWDHNLFWTDLYYKATIAPRAEYYIKGRVIPNVFIVEMNLLWSFDDGVFVPESRAHRIVVMAPDGTVLDVQGDGETVENVFFSSHRLLGRVDRVMR
jgi:hypothetical protein